MLTSIVTRCWSWIVDYLQFQLFITLISLPLLMWWGLPISILSPLGNMIFAPVLSIFLFLSSLLFFTQLCYIPNNAIAWLLNNLCSLWLWALKTDSTYWLYGCPKPPVIFLLAIIGATMLVLHYKKVQFPLVKIGAFGCILLASIYCITLVTQQPNSLQQLVCNNGHITIITSNNKITIVDPGAIGQKMSCLSWAEFTLPVHLLQNYGATEIENLIIMQPSCMTFQAVEVLARKCTIKNLYMPYFSGEIPRFTWSSFFKMRNALQEKKCSIKRLHKKTTVALDESQQLTIAQLPQQITHTQLEFPALQVSTTVAGEQHTITSCKYKAT